MVMYDNETMQPYSIDYREKAPEKSHRDMYLNEDGSFNTQRLSTFGYLSSGVPGTVAGLWEVHEKLALYLGRLYLKMQFIMLKMVLRLLHT